MTGVDLAALPTLDDVGPLLLQVLDEDEAMSAFQVLTAGGYRIVRADRYSALVEAVEAAVTHRHRADGRHGAIHEYGADWSIGCSLCAALAPFRQEQP